MVLYTAKGKNNVEANIAPVCNRVIQIWNILPDSVVESNSINSFKNNYLDTLAK